MNDSTTAFYSDQSILPLLATYIYLQFNFSAQYLIVINDDTQGTNQVIFSYNGTTTHGKVNPSETMTFDSVDAAGIYLKYAGGAPSYRLIARPE